MIQNAPPDLLIVDAVMPYFDGFHLSSELRRLQPGRAARVMMITGKDAVGRLYRHSDGSVDSYADPPFDAATVARLAGELLEAGPLEQGAFRWASPLIQAQDGGSGPPAPNSGGER
jgi:DNA-binding response OmpR family regulator